MRSDSELRGLEKICKIYGSMKCGDTLFVWDYANDEAVPKVDMPCGSVQWKASEKAKHQWLKSIPP